MFERSRGAVRALQEAYRAWSNAAASGAERRREGLQAAHRGLVRIGLSLAVSSAERFARDDSITASWSDIGTEGAVALVKAVELARQYDEQQAFLSQVDRTYLLLVAALEAYRCGRHGMAVALLRRTDFQLPDTQPPSASLMAARLLAGFVASRFAETWREAESVPSQLHERLSGNTEPGSELPTREEFGLLAVGALAQAILSLRDHLATGDTEPLRVGQEWVERSLLLAHASADADLRLFIESFGRAFSGLEKLSLWNVATAMWSIPELPRLVEEWIRHRIQAGKAFLFPTQYQAIIGSRALEPPNALVSMPTGGGKSLLAELFALRAVSTTETGRVLVIVPSRALAAEKREELADGFGWQGSPVRVCQMAGNIAMDSEEALTEHQIIVMTPEKFDTLMRVNFHDQPVAGVVVDEFHMLRTEYRGIKLQLALARFRSRWPDIRALYISAIIRELDFEALSHWTHSPEPFSSEWKPTPSRIGLSDLSNRPALLVSFNDGIEQQIELPVPHPRTNATEQTSAHLIKALVAEDQVLYFHLYWRGHADNHLFEVAEQFTQVGLDMPRVDWEKNRKLAIRLERLAGTGDRMVHYFKAGIGIHWGLLPQPARRIVEEGVRKQAIGLLLATATLAEGVNLPIRTVYLRSYATSHGPLEMSTFLNVVGRAGRPFFHAEGQVILGYCPVGRHKVSREEVEPYHQMKRDALEPIVTAAVQTASMLDEAKEEGLWREGDARPVQDWEARESKEDSPYRQLRVLLAEIENLSSCLLAAINEGLLTELKPSASLDKAMFIGTETEEQRQSVHRLLEVIFLRMSQMGVVTDEGGGPPRLSAWGAVVYQSGFGPESCALLRNALLPILQKYDPHAMNWRWILRGDPDSPRAWRDLSGLLKLPRELWKMGGSPEETQDTYPLGGWVAAVPTEAIAASYQPRGQRRKLGYLETLTRIDGLLAAYGAWVFYTVARIAAHERPMSGWGGKLEELTRACWYGHWDRNVWELLRRDTEAKLLRDDVIVLHRVLGSHGIRRLLDGRMSADAIRNALQDMEDGMRIPEEEVAETLIALAGRRPSAQ